MSKRSRRPGRATRHERPDYWTTRRALMRMAVLPLERQWDVLRRLQAEGVSAELLDAIDQAVAAVRRPLRSG